MNLRAFHAVGFDAARDAALSFLLSKQERNGRWRDFVLPAGLSDSWVTGFVGDALQASHAEQGSAASAGGRAWDFLRNAEVDGGGWSYNPAVPGDADSTLWCLRFARRLGKEAQPVCNRALAFLDTHRQADGGISTYAADAPIRNYIGAPDSISFKGWLQSHVCVSAAAANLATGRDTLIGYLLDRQRADGSWPAYFWFDDEYSTGEAVSALLEATRTGHPRIREMGDSLARARQWLKDRVVALAGSRSARPPAFALACASHALGLDRSDPDIPGLLRLAGASLAAWQRDDGSWGPTVRLRVPHPSSLEPDTTTGWARWDGMPSKPGTVTTPQALLAATFDNFSPDRRGVFTTAAGLKALARIEERTRC